MKQFIIIVISFLFLAGCVVGKPSNVRGSAQFSIPFDFSYPDKQVLRKDKIAQEMNRLEAEMIAERGSQLKAEGYSNPSR